jgi:hypothetical protein
MRFKLSFHLIKLISNINNVNIKTTKYDKATYDAIQRGSHVQENTKLHF